MNFITSSVFVATQERTIQISRAIQGTKLMASDLSIKILESQAYSKSSKSPQ